MPLPTPLSFKPQYPIMPNLVPGVCSMDPAVLQAVLSYFMYEIQSINAFK